MEWILSEINLEKLENVTDVKRFYQTLLDDKLYYIVRFI